MIIELFGPAGAGKTTFAHALRERLNANGHTAEVVLSYQPGAEVSPLDSGGAMAAARRIARAITGTVAIAARPIVRRNEFALAFKLVRALPPRNVIWFLRLSQYVLRLCQYWSLWSGAADITIFDQAFIQATCTLALNSSSASDARLETALSLIPKADLIIRLDAPLEMLDSRLRDRRRREAFAERIFEAQLEKNLAGIRIIDRVYSLLGNRGTSTISLRSHDRSSLCGELNRAEHEINRALRDQNIDQRRSESRQPDQRETVPVRQNAS
jgi:RecA/RadA recombinase